MLKRAPQNTNIVTEMVQIDVKTFQKKLPKQVSENIMKIIKIMFF